MDDSKKKKSEVAAEEKKKAKLVKKERKKYASLKKKEDEEKRKKEKKEKREKSASLPASSSPKEEAGNGGGSGGTGTLDKKNRAGSKISFLTTRRESNAHSSSPSSPRMAVHNPLHYTSGGGSYTSPKAGAELNVDLDKQKVRLRLSRFFSARPTKQELVEKKILYKDFQAETVVVPLRFEGIKALTTYMLEKPDVITREGIFRVPGNVLIVREVWKRMNENPVPDFLKEQLPKEQGPNEFAGALKLYLREAPEPAVPFAYYSKFIDAMTKSPDKATKVKALRTALLEIPEDNFNIVRTLFVFLKNVSNFAFKNKMDVKNIAIVFGPSIVRKEVEESGFMELRSTGYQAEIVTLLLTNIVDILGTEVSELINLGLDDPECQAYLQHQAEVAAAQAAAQAATLVPTMIIGGGDVPPTRVIRIVSPLSQTTGTSPSSPLALTSTISPISSSPLALATPNSLVASTSASNLLSSSPSPSTSPTSLPPTTSSLPPFSLSPAQPKRIIKIVRTPVNTTSSTSPTSPTPTSLLPQTALPQKSATVGAGSDFNPILDYHHQARVAPSSPPPHVPPSFSSSPQ